MKKTLLPFLAAALLAGTACAQKPTAAPAAPAAPAASAAAASAPVTTASGLVYESLKEGTGQSPKATDVVKVHYRGTFLDGKEFDSSYKRGEPTEFPLNRVIPCWTEGVQRMKPGGKARLTCPPAIAYGAAGAGGVIPPNATLRFEVELVSVRR
ncbi:FKBP-type peptidyl-prolyl cis-trans isomerase [Paracidovorax cattleyae]|uniref:Peptidyl-prolyl cis-trans isomerase n=1 Tax=Paracidovorax cattleyae TaxID=80868 RepID=A0A1H0M7L1_9BURK|nr:FKBP-type peptidyl-prolyl cis-trans isomerase FkpA [Paracidovorax cattleyae]